MSDWMMWLAIAGVVVILEMFSGTFYLLMIALGLAAGGVAAVAGVDQPLQMMAAAVVGAGATYALRRSKLAKRHRADAARDPNVNLDIGQSVRVEHWNGGHGMPPTARAMYRGAQWDIELAPGEKAQPGSFIIREVRGSRLIVSHEISNKS